jgi:DNA-binding LacI/PurR family transcriptional regulator
MRALRDLRLTIPGDVSVVGFDDIDLSPHVDPPLTTVHQPIRRKGEEAVHLLLTVVQRRDLAKPEHRRLETRLIVRGSTGPVSRVRQEEVAGTHD